ncbi:hypothetical protein [Flavilitoribacter nigricans]|uniref:Uncharacterized protein n=1 Tax=Flavilitoribacter nigricans (strain ATCC 23147 / DSM 23189 / NBRC 102662 / NCIMB 1420 / SS-2) TaxID=1122177 RepID=A0A2D0NHW6_FLAN2|nr:hypothetical protein [Flavilitoribacter nigricans]PHN08104.1 hypothetical protein CRP01_01930 [Flavilitoribacter nigricans DSM 23189 = NBRC 102662]
MSFFKKIFGKKSAPVASSGKSATSKQNNFLTNSNEFGLGEIELGISGKIRVDGILAIAALEKIAKARNQKCEWKVMYVTLLEEGALTVPVVVSMGEEKYSIYFIYNEEDLLKYKDLVNHVEKTAYPNLIYFSSIPIYDGYQPKKIIEPFQLADLRVENNAVIGGTYAMWWPTKDEKLFSDSKTFEILSKMYEVFQGYETYLTGYVLRQTRIVQETQLQRMTLPEEEKNFVLEAPEGKKVVLAISQEKGIRFLFPVNSTSREYRERFLKGAMVDFLATRIPIEKQQFPRDETTDPNSFDWFRLMSSVIRKQEASGETMQLIGAHTFNVQAN